MAKTYYVLVAIVAGAAILALEVWAARAIAPALGSGPVSWAALLATALAALAAGSLLGGRLSDAAQPERVIAWSLTATAAYLIALSQTYGPLLRWAASQPLLAGEILAAAIVQAVPLAALGTMTPVILHHGQDRAGRWAGIVLAAGSGGGIAGALAAGLLLVPAFGLARSLLVLAALLAVAAAPAIVRGRCRLAAIFALVSLAAAAWCWAHHEQDRVTESLQGQLEVRTSPLATTLLIDGLPQTGLPKQLAPGDALKFGYLLELSLVMRPGTKTALVVGLGGGLAPKLLAGHGVRCRSIELDPAVAGIARREFGFRGDVVLGDARTVLARQESRYDLIFLDACTADRLPWHLFTLEAMRLWRSRLGSDGMLVIQFIGDDGPWSASLVQTVARAFGPGRCTLLAAAAERGPVGPRWLFVGARPAAATARPRGRAGACRVMAASRVAWRRSAADGRPLCRRACLGGNRPPLAEYLPRETIDGISHEHVGWVEQTAHLVGLRSLTGG